MNGRMEDTLDLALDQAAEWCVRLSEGDLSVNYVTASVRDG